MMDLKRVSLSSTEQKFYQGLKEVLLAGWGLLDKSEVMLFPTHGRVSKFRDFLEEKSTQLGGISDYAARKSSGSIDMLLGKALKLLGSENFIKIYQARDLFQQINNHQTRAIQLLVNNEYAWEKSHLLKRSDFVEFINLMRRAEYITTTKNEGGEEVKEKDLEKIEQAVGHVEVEDVDDIDVNEEMVEEIEQEIGPEGRREIINQNQNQLMEEVKANSVASWPDSTSETTYQVEVEVRNIEKERTDPDFFKPPAEEKGKLDSDSVDVIPVYVTEKPVYPSEEDIAAAYSEYDELDIDEEPPAEVDSRPELKIMEAELPELACGDDVICSHWDSAKTNQLKEKSIEQICRKNMNPDADMPTDTPTEALKSILNHTDEMVLKSCISAAHHAEDTRKAVYALPDIIEERLRKMLEVNLDRDELIKQHEKEVLALETKLYILEEEGKQLTDINLRLREKAEKSDELQNNLFIQEKLEEECRQKIRRLQSELVIKKELDQSLKLANDKIANLQEMIEAQDIENRDLEEQLEERDARIAELEKLVGRKKSLVDAFNEIQQDLAKKDEKFKFE